MRKRPIIKIPIKDIVKNVYGNIQNNDFECFAGCGAIMNINTRQILHRGHIQAYSQNGSDCLENLRPECGPCNQIHKEENMFDYMKRNKLRPPPNVFAIK